MKSKITLLMCFIFTISFAQQQEVVEGEIIISRDNLISLLQKFKRQKDKIPTYDKSTNSVKSKAEYNWTRSFDSMQNKMVLLEKEIYRLKRKIDSLPNRTLSKDTIFKEREKVVRRSNVKVDTIQKTYVKVDTVKRISPKQQSEVVITDTTPSTDGYYERQVAELNRKYDQLLANQILLLNATNRSEKPREKESKKVKSDSIPTNKSKDIVVRTPVKVVPEPNIKVETIVVRDTLFIKDKPVIAKEEKDTVYSNLVEKYGGLKKMIFFDNNSAEVEPVNSKTIFEITSVINQNPNIDVYLEGFASKKGNPLYNEKLSLKRTKAVKEYLISKGVHPKRILSHYHGVDYNATDEKMARRVDLTFIIRK
jgi:outer membrane protein OmpA-like peptidoglycan-associated protein